MLLEEIADRAGDLRRHRVRMRERRARSIDERRDAAGVIARDPLVRANSLDRFSGALFVVSRSSAE
jgi:hypothetical protein